MNDIIPKLVVDTRYLLSPIDNINFDLIISYGIDVICINLSSYSYCKSERWQWLINNSSKSVYELYDVFSKDKIIKERAFNGYYFELASTVLDMIENNKNKVRLTSNYQDIITNKKEGLLSVVLILDSNNIEDDTFLHEFYSKLGIFLINGEGSPKIYQSHLLSDDAIISCVKKKSLIEIDISSTFEKELREKLKYNKEFKAKYCEYQILYKKYLEEPRNEILRENLFILLDELNSILSVDYENFTTELERVIKLIESSLDISTSNALSFICVGSNMNKYTLHPKKMDENINFSIINDILIQKGYSKSDILKITGLNFIRYFLL